MGVYHDGRLTEAIPQNDAGRLPPDAGQLDQLLHRLRNLAVVFFNQVPAAADDVFGFILIESGRPDLLLQNGLIGLSIVFRALVLLEQMRRDLVDTIIGALGRKDCGDQKLKGIGMMEFDLRIRKFTIQDFDEMIEFFQGEISVLGTVQIFHRLRLITG